MKFQIYAALLAIGLAGCEGGSTKQSDLTAAECSRLHDRTNRLGKAELGVDMATIEGAEQRQKVIAACAAGETYTREDFDCVSKATNLDEMNGCNLIRHL